MPARMGSVYLLHLAEALAQRRRLARSQPYHRTQNLGLFLRLFGVLGVGVTGLCLLVLSLG